MDLRYINKQGDIMKLRYIKIGFLVLFLCFVIYALIGLLPFIGSPYVSVETSASFSMNNFFGQYEIPERVMLLEDSRESFFHRVNLITKAEKRILFTTYAFNGGETSDIIIGALLYAAERGVNVTLLHNAIGGAMPGNYINVLAAHDNIDVYRFNRFNFFQPQFINAALHDKYMVVDDIYLILGGRNLGDRYYAPDGFTGRQTLDREVLVFNTDPDFNGSIADVTDYFHDKINSDHTAQYNREQGRGWETEKNRFIIRYLEHQNRLGLTQFDYHEGTVGVNRITLITNNFDTPKNESIVAYNLMRMTQNSQVIVAQSPYVSLTGGSFEIFAETVMGRDVTLLTNSLASSPNLPSFSSYLVSRQRIVNTGISLYEFQDTHTSIHGKTYLFDGRLTAIGSFNLNERSIRSDTESMLIIDSERFHDITLEAINHQIARSLRVNSDNRYDLISTVEEAHVSLVKRFVFTAAGHIFRFLWFMF